jgi:predicted AlkP superfamily phosphohydrolase/phosphomutase
MKGFARFFLERNYNGIYKLYMTPIHPHPSMPLPMSYPYDLAEDVWKAEPYKTMGWALDTWTTGDGLMDEELLLQDVDFTVTRYEKMMERFLADNDRDLFVQVFSFPDRVGHILWKHWDEGHPFHKPEVAERYQEAMRETYRRMDRIVGKAMDMVDLNNTLFMVCSDHGFSSFRYQFNYNTWLVDQGYMKLKKNVLGEPMELDDLNNKSSPLEFVDWENTKAYAFGLGMIFINLEGREPEGSVSKEEYDEVCRQLAADLEAYVDPKTGLKPVTRVFLRDEIYHGYDPKETPDLRVATAFNFRVSWDTTLGGMPAEIVEPNPRNWSGDHCSLDPEDVKGILFTSRPITKENPRMADICPSIMSFLGVDHGIDMDGEVFLER